MSKPLVLPGPHGRIEVSGDALEGIVAGAVAQTDGASAARGRHATTLALEEGAFRVEVALTVAAGAILPDVGEQVQRAVADALRTTTGLEASVDVVIAGVQP